MSTIPDSPDTGLSLKSVFLSTRKIAADHTAGEAIRKARHIFIRNGKPSPFYSDN